MSNQQVLCAVLILAAVCVALVWWLERFNRELLIRQFHEQIEQLPTYLKPNGDA